MSVIEAMARAAEDADSWRSEGMYLSHADDAVRVTCYCESCSQI